MAQGGGCETGTGTGGLGLDGGSPAWQCGSVFLMASFLVPAVSPCTLGSLLAPRSLGLGAVWGGRIFWGGGRCSGEKGRAALCGCSTFFGGVVSREAGTQTLFEGLLLTHLRSSCAVPYLSRRTWIFRSVQLVCRAPTEAEQPVLYLSCPTLLPEGPAALSAPPRVPRAGVICFSGLFSQMLHFMLSCAFSPTVSATFFVRSCLLTFSDSSR